MNASRMMSSDHQSPMTPRDLAIPHWVVPRSARFPFISVSCYRNIAHLLHDHLQNRPKRTQLAACRQPRQPLPPDLPSYRKSLRPLSGTGATQNAYGTEDCREEV